MADPHEPNPQDTGDLDIEQKRAVLEEALTVFRATVLDNDYLFTSIRATLTNGESSADGEQLLPRFNVTPNIKDGTYRLCLEESDESYVGDVEAETGAVGAMFFTFATMKYVPICTTERDDEGKLTGVIVEKEFAELALGRDTAKEKPSKEEAAAIETAVRTVLQGTNDIAHFCSKQGVEVVADDFGRPQILEDFENTSYINDEA